MVPALIISTDSAFTDQLESALAGAGGVAVVRKLASYPVEHEFVRIIRAYAPQLFFIDAGRLREAVATIGIIEQNAPGTHVIACGRHADQNALIELMRAGVREYVVVPGGTELAAAVKRCLGALERKPPAVPSTDRMFTFLPSKPGVGCSTVALNMAVAMSELSDTRTLLADFDLACGAIGFSLHIEADRCIVHAAEHASELDEELWPRLVVNRGNLDVIPSGGIRPGFRIDPAQIRYITAFARRNYDVICADVSGLMERYSIELMQESKCIFLVCTPELPSVYLARQKVEFLRTLDLEDRIRILLNRAQKHSLVSEREIEQVTGLRVMASFPNDYRGVHRALTDGKPVQRSSELGRRFLETARRLTGPEAGAEPVHRFVDYFTLSPARFTLRGEGGQNRGAA